MTRGVSGKSSPSSGKAGEVFAAGVFRIARDGLRCGGESALSRPQLGGAKRSASACRIPEGTQSMRGVEWQSHDVVAIY